MRDIRISIAVIVTLLVSIGIAMIYSSSGVYALEELGDKTYFLTRHLLFLLIGLMASFAVCLQSLRGVPRLRSNSTIS